MAFLLINSWQSSQPQVQLMTSNQHDVCHFFPTLCAARTHRGRKLHIPTSEVIWMQNRACGDERRSMVSLFNDKHRCWEVRVRGHPYKASRVWKFTSPWCCGEVQRSRPRHHSGLGCVGMSVWGSVWAYEALWSFSKVKKKKTPLFQTTSLLI